MPARRHAHDFRWILICTVCLFGARAAWATDYHWVGAPTATPPGSQKAEISDRPPAGISEDDSSKVLGEKVGMQVSFGFLFVDGTYLDAPYRVTRLGRRVTINGVAVKQWDRWPLPDLRVDTDPGKPPGLTERSTLDDLRDKKNPENGFWLREYRYLFQHFPPEEARQRMAEWFRGLPFVGSATFKYDTYLVIKMKNGEEEAMGMKPPAADSPYSWEVTNKDVAARLDRERDRWESKLKEGGAFFFFFTKSRTVILTPKMAARDLGLIVGILRSGRSQEEKVGLLQRMELVPPTSVDDIGMFRPLMTQFRASKQLEERIADLVKATGITPRQLKDIPAEVPYERAKRLRDEADKIGAENKN